MLERFSVNDDVRPFYLENGYLVLSDLYSREDLEAARDAVFQLYESRFEDQRGDARGLDVLQQFYDSEADVWRQCARRMWDLPHVYGLAAKPSVQMLLEQIGLEMPMISTRPEVRTDMPGDDQYRQPWHQDWRYGQGSVNSVTIWCPLHDTTVENGTIDVMPGSHLMGYLETQELSNPRRFEIVDDRIDSEEYGPAELNFGEAILFSQFLVHRSGHNRSGKPRVTTQQRFTDGAEPRFVANGLPAPADSTLLWDTPPTERDVREIFAVVS
jgi:ectoine hydroxylase-related dioxygenase (phytanoyl-CoA dioxygenase family)